MRIDFSVLASKFPSMVRKFYNVNDMDLSYEYDLLSVIRGRNKKYVKVLIFISGEVIFYNYKKKTLWKVCDFKVRVEERCVWYRVYFIYEYYEIIFFF